MAKKGGVKGALSYLLNKGFVLTRAADSWAIANGGATFYRNRIKTYTKEGKSKAEAEDVLLMGFSRIFKKMATYQGNGSFEGWVRKIIINTAIKNNLKKSVSHEEIGLEHVKEDSAGPEIFSLLSEEELIKLIFSLPDGYRMVFNLFAIEGYSHDEIAKLLKISENTSKSQLHKARIHLQEWVLKENLK